MTDTSTCPGLPEMVRLVSGETDLAELERLHDHVRTCPVCQQTMRRLRLGEALGQLLQSDGLRMEPADKLRAREVLRGLHHVISPADTPATEVRTTSDIFEAVSPRPENWAGILQPAQGPDEIGRLGHYRVLRVLGRGGMGTVFAAEDTHLGRPVALKVLRRDLLDDPQSRDRFVREARSAAGVRDDHIVTVYQVGFAGSVPFLAMELLEGETLDSLIHRVGRLPLAEVLRIGREVAQGLAVAHHMGLIHRDVKPANIWLETRRSAVRPLPAGVSASSAPTPVPRSAAPRVKLLDFGLARVADGKTNLTATGQFVGTPNYIAPEQACGEPVDGRADLFSLGCVLYEMVAGVRAFPGESVIVVLRAVAMAHPRPLAQVAPGVPPALVELIDRLLAKKPEDRPDTAEGVVEALQAIEAGQRPLFPERALPPHVPPVKRMTRRQWLLIGSGAAVAAGGAALGAWRPWSRRPGAVPGFSGPPVKVGALFGTSGRFALEGEGALDATLLAVEEVNAAGGVLGRPLEPVVADLQSNARQAAALADRLIRDEAQVIFGPYYSPARRFARVAVEEHNHLLFYPTSSEGLELSPNVVHIGATLGQKVAEAMPYFLNRLGRRRLFLVSSDNVVGQATHQFIRDAIAGTVVEIIGETFLPPGDVEPLHELAHRIAAAKADLVVQNLTGDSTAEFYRQARAAGLRADASPILSFTLDEPAIRHLDPDDVAGHYAANSYFQSLERPENREFVKRFQAKFGSSRAVGETMASAYSAVHLWAKAATAAGSVEPAAVRAALPGVRFDSPSGEVWVDGETQHAWRRCRLGRAAAGGQFEIVWGNDVPLKPEPYPKSRKREEWDMFLAELQQKWAGGWENPAR